MAQQDWRLTNQEKHLKERELIYTKFISDLPEEIPEGVDPRQYNDHEHCKFCHAKFMQDVDGGKYLTHGYCTTDRYYWICETCYNDFKDMFHWKIVEETGPLVQWGWAPAQGNNNMWGKVRIDNIDKDRENEDTKE